MADDSKLQSSDEQILQFVQHLKEVLAKIANPPPEDLLHLQNVLHGFESKNKLNPDTFHLIGNILYEKTNPTMGEISQYLSVPLSTATRMANWWVDNGYARRLSDPDDRRVVRMTLTNSGRQLLEMIEDTMIRNVQRITACLTPEERTILITLSGKVAASLRDSRD